MKPKKTITPEQALRKIESALLQVKPKSDPKSHARYVGGVGHPDRSADEQSRLVFLGLMTGQVDELDRKGFGFQEEDLEAIWDHVWMESEIFEALTLAIGYFLHPKRYENASDYWPMLKRWAARIDNWAHSDCLSKLVARALETDPSTVLPTLKKWTSSKNPWLRRQSVVGLIYYKSSRKKFPPKDHVFKTIEALVDDPHFYVQKGVGWALREAYQIWPGDQLHWVRKNASRIPTAGYFATVEKYPPALKDEMKTLRKSARTQKKSGPKKTKA